MANEKIKRYYIVDGDALPDVFIRVTEAQELIDTGEAQTVAEAVNRVGISRSAYYKYKDAIQAFQNVAGGRIITFRFMLRDWMGVLSTVLGVFADTGANILTINQGIPTNGVAPVTITANTDLMSVKTEELLSRLGAVEGVIHADVVAG